MTNRVLVLFTCSMIFSTFCLATTSPEVIYGIDNRKDIYESTNEIHRQLAKSTAAMIPNDKLKITAGSELVQIIGKTLQKLVNLCSTENYASQITAANCSGFLVSDIHLVTAGHCITDHADCAGNKWVFDYSNDIEPIIATTDFFVDKSKIYSCKRIIERSLGNGARDFAVIELNRPVLDRNPLKIRSSGTIITGTPLVVIGHPTGLPTKIADGGFVESVTNIEFVADVDTYGGNSGSAVFNDTTGEVEGILVRGSEDYVAKSSKGCMVSSKCRKIDGSVKCRGESITKITVIKSLDPRFRPPSDAEIQALLVKEPNIMSDLATSKYKGCHLKTTNPIYNQLYINNMFKGNYRKKTEDEVLKSYIAMYVLDGSCVKKLLPVPEPKPIPEPKPVPQPKPIPEPKPVPRPKPVPEVETVPVITETPILVPNPIPQVIPVDPEKDRLLIQDFINFKYGNCHVKTNVRVYNQFYANGRFVENFMMERDDQRMAQKLRKYIEDGICVLKR